VQPLLKFLSSFLSAVCLIVITQSCDIQGQQPQKQQDQVTIRDLYRKLRNHQRILIVDGWSNDSYRRELRDLVKSYHQQRWQLEVKSYNQISSDDLISQPAILVGHSDQNFWISKFRDRLPFSVSGGNLIVGNDNFPYDTHGLALSYFPNPLNAEMPLGIITAGNESLLWDLVNHRLNLFNRGNWGYEVYQGVNRVLLGNLSQSGNHRWTVDSLHQVRLPSKVVHQWSSAPFVFRSYHENLNRQSLNFLETECQRELSEIMEFSGYNGNLEPIHYTVYPSTEIKGLMTGNTDQSHMDFSSSEIHAAFNSHFSNRYYGKENQLILRRILGESAHPALELGLAVYFTSEWQQQGYGYWANYLTDGGMTIPISSLLDPNQFEQFSTLCLPAFAGSLVEFLIDYWGKEKFLEQYSDWSPSPDEVESLNQLWLQSLEAKNPVVSHHHRSPVPYLKGFNFTHEGYQIFNGYGSKLSEASLNKLKLLGANAVAVVPYSWMRDPHRPAAFRFSNRPGSENDEGVIHALQEAKDRKLFTILKPHVWMGDSWPGEVEMRSAADWELFFQHYRRWIFHYAVMAEMYRADALCIGVEFSKATLGQEANWRELISDIRKIYSGNLTYAANWGDEFEQIGFWDQLDLIGLNCYYPLSNNPAATDSELTEGFEQVLKKVERVKSKFNKPVVFTEIGFRSIEAPWMQPHADAGEKLFNEEHQARAYNAVFEAMKANPVVDGVLWWKWPTNPGFQMEQDRRFVPASKQAEDIIELQFRSQEPD